MFLLHRPSRLAKLKNDWRMDIGDGNFRIDTQLRISRNGRMISIDASYEGLGRQLYVMDIGRIPDHPSGNALHNSPILTLR